MNIEYRQYLRKRLKEPSTWRGVTILLSGVGIVISPDQLAQIASAGLIIAGVIGVATPDNTKGKEQNKPVHDSGPAPAKQPDEVTHDHRA